MIERVFLVGYRGTGKSATARWLAERLGWTWQDADHVLEERFGTTIRQIFEAEGEEGFRAKESGVLEELAACRHCVIATGGGGVLRPENRAKLKTGAVIWLTAEPATIWQRLQDDTTTAERRPNLGQGGLAEIEELQRARRPLYEACADWTIDTTNRAPEEVSDLIVVWLKGQGAVDILNS